MFNTDLWWIPSYIFSSYLIKWWRRKTQPFCSALTRGLFFMDSRILSIFSSVTKDWFFPLFPLFLFRLVSKHWYFLTLHWMILLHGTSRWYCKLGCCQTWLNFLLSIYFAVIIIRSSVFNWSFFFFFWWTSTT